MGDKGMTGKMSIKAICCRMQGIFGAYHDLELRGLSRCEQPCSLTSNRSGDNFELIPSEGDFFVRVKHRTSLGDIDDLSGTHNDFGEILGSQGLCGSATL